MKKAIRITKRVIALVAIVLVWCYSSPFDLEFLARPDFAALPAMLVLGTGFVIIYWLDLFVAH